MGRQKEKYSDLSTGSLPPNAHRSWSGARPKLEAQNSIQVSMCMAGPQGLGALAGCLPGCLVAGSWNRERSKDWNPGTQIGYASVASGVFTAIANTSPWLQILSPRVSVLIRTSFIQWVYKSHLLKLHFWSHKPFTTGLGRPSNYRVPFFVQRDFKEFVEN